MVSFRIDDTVGAVVARRPALSRVFEQMGIDYCCGGKKTLGEACRKKGSILRRFSSRNGRPHPVPDSASDRGRISPFLYGHEAANGESAMKNARTHATSRSTNHGSRPAADSARGAVSRLLALGASLPGPSPPRAP